MSQPSSSTALHFLAHLFPGSTTAVLTVSTCGDTNTGKADVVTKFSMISANNQHVPPQFDPLLDHPEHAEFLNSYGLETRFEFDRFFADHSQQVFDEMLRGNHELTDHLDTLVRELHLAPGQHHLQLLSP